MSDDFERRLERWFNTAPALPDEDLFAARVRLRLDQGQTLRRMVIGVVGGAGALVATAQLLSANLPGRVTQAGAETRQALELGWGALTRDASGVLAAVPLQGEMVWTLAALASVAAAFVATRLAEPL